MFGPNFGAFVIRNKIHRKRGRSDNRECLSILPCTSLPLPSHSLERSKGRSEKERKK